MAELNKYERQNKIMNLLEINPEYNQKMISKRLNVSISTICRDINDLIKKDAISKKSDRFKINPGYCIENIKFSATEAFSLYQAAALAVDRYDYSNPDLVSSLFKLSNSLTKTHPHFSKLLHNIAENHNENDNSKKYEINTEVIIEAWSSNNPVNIKYRSRSLNDIKRITGYIMDFKPYPDGHDNHLIIFNTQKKGIEAPRFKRIERVSISGNISELPDMENYKNIFNSAWKIWISDNGPQKVELLFDKSIKERVLETKWHKNQTVTENDDGSLLWECYISEPREMEYWILGWGSNVKVINPPTLKQRIQDEIKKLKNIYGIS